MSSTRLLQDREEEGSNKGLGPFDSRLVFFGLLKLTLPPMTSRSGKRVHDSHPAPVCRHGQRPGLAFGGRGRNMVSWQSFGDFRESFLLLIT